MPESGRAPKPDRPVTHSTQPSKPAAARVGQRPDVARLLALQNTAGNRAVQRMLKPGAPPPAAAAPTAADENREDAPDPGGDAIFEMIRRNRAQEVAAMQPDTAGSAGGAGSAGAGTSTGIVSAMMPAGAGVPRSRPRSESVTDFEAPAARARGEAVTEASAPQGRSRAGATSQASGVSEVGLQDQAIGARYSNETENFGFRAWNGYDKNRMKEESPEEFAWREQMAAEDNTVTHYLSKEEQDAATLGLRPPTEAGGGAKLMKGEQPASFSNAAYVMTPEGKVITTRGATVPEATTAAGAPQAQRLHHSSLAAGGDVVGAGHIGTKGGKVTKLDDDSGHYTPDEAHTYKAFKTLADQGVLDPTSATGKVGLVDKTGGDKVGGPREVGKAEVHFSGYEQAGGNEAAIRQRIALRAELESKAAGLAAPRAAPASAAPTPTAASAGGAGAGADAPRVGAGAPTAAAAGYDVADRLPDR